MPTPRHGSGALSATQVTLYKVSEGRYAVLVGLSFVNTGGSNRDVTILLRKRGEATARQLAFATLSTGATSNDWTLGEERYVLESGCTIEAFQAAGTDVDWNLSALEYTNP